MLASWSHSGDLSVITDCWSRLAAGGYPQPGMYPQQQGMYQQQQGGMMGGRRKGGGLGGMGGGLLMGGGAGKICL